MTKFLPKPPIDPNKQARKKAKKPGSCGVMIDQQYRILRNKAHREKRGDMGKEPFPTTAKGLLSSMLRSPEGAYMIAIFMVCGRAFGQLSSRLSGAFKNLGVEQVEEPDDFDLTPRIRYANPKQEADELPVQKPQPKAQPQGIDGGKVYTPDPALTKKRSESAERGDLARERSMQLTGTAGAFGIITKLIEYRSSDRENPFYDERNFKTLNGLMPGLGDWMREHEGAGPDMREFRASLSRIYARNGGTYGADRDDVGRQLLVEMAPIVKHWKELEDAPAPAEELPNGGGYRPTESPANPSPSSPSDDEEYKLPKPGGF